MDLLLLANEDGIVDMPITAIQRRTNVPLETLKRAISVLESPDARSRTPDHEGRRIIKLDGCDWGWWIVNFEKYRAIATSEQKRFLTRNRTAHYREKPPSEIGQTKGYVYYAMVPNALEIKIGFSKNPWARMREFQAARPGMVVIAAEKTVAATEQLRHKQFEALKIDREWFRYEGALIEHTQTIADQHRSSPVPLRSNYVATTSASVSASASPSATEREPERKPLPTDEIRTRVNVLFKRGDSDPWAYDELSYLVDVSKRPHCLDELKELEGWYKKGTYRPQKVSSLLSDWTGTLDRARNNDETIKRNSAQRVSASVGTANEGRAHLYAGAADRTLAKRNAGLQDAQRSVLGKDGHGGDSLPK